MKTGEDIARRFTEVSERFWKAAEMSCISICAIWDLPFPAWTLS